MLYYYCTQMLLAPVIQNFHYIHEVWGNVESNEKEVIFFNRDWTLIRPKSGRFLPQEPDDWEFMPNVYNKLAELLNQGSHIVITSNIPGIVLGYTTLELHEAINQELLSRCGAQYKDQISFFIADSPDSPLLKPKSEVFNKISERISINMYDSRVVGDTSDDVYMASHFNLAFTPAADYFSWSPQVTILCGFPGSGMTTHCRKYHPHDIRVCMDEIVRSINMDYHIEWKSIYYDVEKKIMNDGLHYRASIVIDRTNLSKGRRKRFIEMIRDYLRARQAQTQHVDHIPIICKYFELPLDLCKERHELKHIKSERQLREMEEFFDRMEGEFEPPDMDEGFDRVIVLDKGILMV